MDIELKRMIDVKYAGDRLAPVKLATIADILERPFYGRGLTNREHEVARLCARGLLIDEIAEELVISPRTARHHLDSAKKKLKMKPRELPRYIFDKIEGVIEAEI